MNLPEDELTFLRDLVKASRQRSQVVNWVDRDGTKRHTALNAAEATRLNLLAHRRGVNTAELLRQAAHLPATQARKVEPQSQ